MLRTPPSPGYTLRTKRISDLAANEQAEELKTLPTYRVANYFATMG